MVSTIQQIQKEVQYSQVAEWLTQSRWEKADQAVSYLGGVTVLV